MSTINQYFWMIVYFTAFLFFLQKNVYIYIKK